MPTPLLRKVAVPSDGESGSGRPKRSSVNKRLLENAQPSSSPRKRARLSIDSRTPLQSTRNKSTSSAKKSTPRQSPRNSFKTPARSLARKKSSLAPATPIPASARKPTTILPRPAPEPQSPAEDVLLMTGPSIRRSAKPRKSTLGSASNKDSTTHRRVRWASNSPPQEVDDQMAFYENAQPAFEAHQDSPRQMLDALEDDEDDTFAFTAAGKRKQAEQPSEIQAVQPDIGRDDEVSPELDVGPLQDLNVIPDDDGQRSQPANTNNDFVNDNQILPDEYDMYQDAGFGFDFAGVQPDDDSDNEMTSNNATVLPNTIDLESADLALGSTTTEQIVPEPAVSYKADSHESSPVAQENRHIELDEAIDESLPEQVRAASQSPGQSSPEVNSTQMANVSHAIPKSTDDSIEIFLPVQASQPIRRLVHTAPEIIAPPFRSINNLPSPVPSATPSSTSLQVNSNKAIFPPPELLAEPALSDSDEDLAYMDVAEPEQQQVTEATNLSFLPDEEEDQPIRVPERPASLFSPTPRIAKPDVPKAAYASPQIQQASLQLTEAINNFLSPSQSSRHLLPPISNLAQESPRLNLPVAIPLANISSRKPIYSRPSLDLAVASTPIRTNTNPRPSETPAQLLAKLKSLKASRPSLQPLQYNSLMPPPVSQTASSSPGRPYKPSLLSISKMQSSSSSQLAMTSPEQALLSSHNDFGNSDEEINNQSSLAAQPEEDEPEAENEAQLEQAPILQRKLASPISAHKDNIFAGQQDSQQNTPEKVLASPSSDDMHIDVETHDTISTSSISARSLDNAQQPASHESDEAPVVEHSPKPKWNLLQSPFHIQSVFQKAVKLLSPRNSSGGLSGSSPNGPASGKLLHDNDSQSEDDVSIEDEDNVLSMGEVRKTPQSIGRGLAAIAQLDRDSSSSGSSNDGSPSGFISKETQQLLSEIASSPSANLMSSPLGDKSYDFFQGSSPTQTLSATQLAHVNQQENEGFQSPVVARSTELESDEDPVPAQAEERPFAVQPASTPPVPSTPTDPEHLLTPSRHKVDLQKSPSTQPMYAVSMQSPRTPQPSKPPRVLFSEASSSPVAPLGFVKQRSNAYEAGHQVNLTANVMQAIGSAPIAGPSRHNAIPLSHSPAKSLDGTSVQIRSTDPAVAAHVAAILKVHHDFVPHNEVDHANVSNTARWASLLHQAESDVISQMDEMSTRRTHVSASPRMLQRTNVYLSPRVQWPKRGSEWNKLNWRSLETVVKMAQKHAFDHDEQQPTVHELVDAFIREMDLHPEELDGHWSRRKLTYRVEALLERRCDPSSLSFLQLPDATSRLSSYAGSRASSLAFDVYEAEVMRHQRQISNASSRLLMATGGLQA